MVGVVCQLESLYQVVQVVGQEYCVGVGFGQVGGVVYGDVDVGIGEYWYVVDFVVEYQYLVVFVVQVFEYGQFVVWGQVVVGFVDVQFGSDVGDYW